MNHKVKLYIDDLESNIKLADNQSDDEVKSLLAKIVCIRISGLLEVALKSRISDYSERKTPKEIKRFLTQKFKDITNLIGCSVRCSEKQMLKSPVKLLI